jgi:hypothetical protein
MKKTLLIIATIILISVAVSVVYFKLSGTKIADKNEKGVDQNVSSDTASKDGIPAESEVISQDQFVKSDLTYTPTFLGFSVPSDVEKSENNIIIDSVSYSDNSIKLILQQKQSCSSARKLPSQAGFYFYKDGILVLYNMVNNSAVEAPEDCVVRLEYVINNFVIDSASNLIVRWQTEKNLQTAFPICFYNGKPYNDQDVFVSTDKCSTCTCNNGVVKCEENKKCIENLELQAKQISEVNTSVYADYPDYQKYEGIEKDNECQSDSACYTGGCLQEICSPTNGVTSECAAVSKIENISCKCVNTKCQWVK